MILENLDVVMELNHAAHKKDAKNKHLQQKDQKEAEEIMIVFVIVFLVPCSLGLGSGHLLATVWGGWRQLQLFLFLPTPFT